MDSGGFDRGENFFQITAAAAERTTPYAMARLSIPVKS
jgi:hypothetical protein